MGSASKLALFVMLIAATHPALAGSVTVSGNLDGTALSPSPGVSLVFYLDAVSPPDGAPYEHYNVALYPFTVAVNNSSIGVTSTGYAAGGFLPYLALFAGTGPTATFLDDTFFHVNSGWGDVNLSLNNVASGQYTLAISMWNNASCAPAGACSNSSGVLGDGFTGLPQYDDTLNRPLYFEVTLRTSDDQGGEVPEPTAAVPLAVAGAWILWRRANR